MILLSQGLLEFIFHIFTSTYLLYLHLYPYLQYLFKSKVSVVQFQCSLFLQLQEIPIILNYAQGVTEVTPALVWLVG